MPRQTAAPTALDPAALVYGEPRARWVLAATVLGSGMAFLDATVVNVAVPSIGADLDADLAGLAWVVNGYVLPLAALILLGGSLGDRFGRRRVFLVGVWWFAGASLLCGLAPDTGTLVAARALQGVGGALLTPGSLAILQASFRTEDRGRAIGAWSGLGGLAAAAGPFVGGWLVDVASWRWIFLLNVPLAVLVAVAARHVPESRDPDAARSLDLPGVLLVVAGLGGLTYGLLAAAEAGPDAVPALAPMAAGLLALLGFLVRERLAREPMLPLGLFSSRVFSAVNAVTFAVYAALSAVPFWLVLFLQEAAGYGALAAGATLVPVTVLLLLLSSRAGALGSRTGPRLPLTVGPLLAAAGVAGLATLDRSVAYWTDLLPWVLLFGLGLAVTVAPLTAAVLAAVPDHNAGIASGVNNAVARTAGLLAVAALPLVVGLGGTEYGDPDRLVPAFRTAVLVCAGLLALGALLALLTVRRPREQERRRAGVPSDAAGSTAAEPPR